MDDNLETYCVISDQVKIKILTKIFNYLIIKNVDNINFNVFDDSLVFNNVTAASKLAEFKLMNSFFDKINIVNKEIVQFPIVNIIKDLKSYKGKKIFPHVYFIFKEDMFIIRSNYIDSNVELSNIISNQYYINNNSYSLESLISNKQSDLSFVINIEKLNILLNNTYIKEVSELEFTDKHIKITFVDTHGNIKIMRCNINHISDNMSTIKRVVFVNIVLKDLMKFFKDNNICIHLFVNEERLMYNVMFNDDNIIFKLTSMVTVHYD